MRSTACLSFGIAFGFLMLSHSTRVAIAQDQNIADQESWFCPLADEFPEWSRPGGAPDIECEESVYDFGRADNNLDIEHTFVLTNTGNKALKISDVRTSCGCAIAKVSSKDVPPGGESEVTARLRLKGRKGHQRKSITVLSNDPDTPKFMLYVKGEAIPPVEVHPSRALFGQIEENTVAEKTIEIRSNLEDPLNITSIESKSEQFTAEHEVIEEGKLHRVTIRTNPPLPVGRAQAALVIKTDNEAYPGLSVLAYYNVIGELSYSPKKIILPQTSKPVRRYVIVSSGKTREFEIEKVETPDESIEVEIMPMGKNGYRIRLENIVATEDLKEKSVKVITNVEKMKEIVIPISLIAPAKRVASDGK